MRRTVSELSEQMIAFFQNYEASEGLPSFEKFASSVGCDGEEVREMCEKSEHFARAYRRCLAILRDRLTDAALLRRYDPSFCKYVLDTLNDADDIGGEDTPLAVEVRIV